MSSFKKYDTLTGANKGQVLKLRGSDGKETEDWIKVRGIDSDAFQLASRNMRRELMQFLEEKGTDAKISDDYIKATFEQQRKLTAALVIEWSFDEPFTVDNVIELFTQAPYIAEQVDTFASKRERFAST